MAVTLADEQLPALFDLVRKEQGSEKFCGEIKSKLENRLCDFEFIVDSWPDVRAAVTRTNPSFAKEKFTDHKMSIFTKHSAALKTLLLHPGVLNWLGQNIFTAVIKELVPVVVSAIQENNLPYRVSDPCFVLTTTKEKLNMWPIPEGFQVCELQPNQSEFVNSFWKFSDESSNTYIKYLIETRPSCALYNGEGELVGYALTYHYGCLGFLHVLEGHRRKGYAKVIVSHLTNKCFQAGIDVFVIVESDNTVSGKLHEDVGFEKIPNYNCQWIYCNC